jgi:hypothetical protein
MFLEREIERERERERQRERESERERQDVRRGQDEATVVIIQCARGLTAFFLLF